MSTHFPMRRKVGLSEIVRFLADYNGRIWCFSLMIRLIKHERSSLYRIPFRVRSTAHWEKESESESKLGRVRSFGVYKGTFKSCTLPTAEEDVSRGGGVWTGKGPPEGGEHHPGVRAMWGMINDVIHTISIPTRDETRRLFLWHKRNSGNFLYGITETTRWFNRGQIRPIRTWKWGRHINPRTHSGTNRVRVIQNGLIKIEG